MTKFRFQIVRRPNGRFGWIFVRLGRSGRVRVVARSVRDWGSPQKVERAIGKLKSAPVDDTTVGQAPFQLPNTRFQIVRGVVPLMVDDDEFPEDDDSAFVERTVLFAQPAAKPAKAARRRSSRSRSKRAA